MATYPTRGIELVVPSNAELPFLGWGANFNRRGHDYGVRFLPSGLSIERDGVRVARWDDVPAMVQKIIVKTREAYAPSFAAYRCPRGIDDCRCGAEYCRDRRG
jgi:hypothetical protein